MAKIESPFGPGWSYVTTECGSRDGVGFHRSLWRNRRTKDLKWYDITKHANHVGPRFVSVTGPTSRYISG